MVGACRLPFNCCKYPDIKMRRRFYDFPGVRFCDIWSPGWGVFTQAERHSCRLQPCAEINVLMHGRSRSSLKAIRSCTHGIGKGWDRSVTVFEDNHVSELNPLSYKTREADHAFEGWSPFYYSNVRMSAMASHITGVSIVCPPVCSDANQWKHQR